MSPIGGRPVEMPAKPTKKKPRRKARLLSKKEIKIRWNKGKKTGKDGMTFAKYKLRRMGWRYGSFEGPKGGDPSGIVDLVALRVFRNKRGHLRDRLKIFLFQVKGNGQEVSAKDKKRLRDAVRKVEVRWAYSEKPKGRMPLITSQEDLE